MRGCGIPRGFWLKPVRSVDRVKELLFLYDPLHKYIFFDDFFFFSKSYLVDFFWNFWDTLGPRASWAKCSIDNF
jgi:hypothetical protein